MNQDDYNKLLCEETVRAEMLKHVEALELLVKRIPIADGLHEKIRILYYEVKYWGL